MTSDWTTLSACFIIFWFAIYLTFQRLAELFFPRVDPVERWKSMTRSISVLHAIIVSIGSLTVVFYGSDNAEILTNYYGHLKYPYLIDRVHEINAIMFGYLVVDGIHLIAVRIEPFWHLTALHHFVGAASMIMFMNNDGYLFNSLFFSMTELSTIFLHLTWFGLKNGIAILAIVSVLVTWLLFIGLRVTGGSFILVLYILNYDHFKTESWPVFIFGIGGNTILLIMNFYWYVKITQSIFERLCPNQNVTKL